MTNPTQIIANRLQNKKKKKSNGGKVRHSTNMAYPAKSQWIHKFHSLESFRDMRGLILINVKFMTLLSNKTDVSNKITMGPQALMLQSSCPVN